MNKRFYFLLCYNLCLERWQMKVKILIHVVKPVRPASRTPWHQGSNIDTEPNCHNQALAMEYLTAEK